MEAVALICEFNTKKKSNSTGDSIYDTIQEIAPDLGDIMTWCMWKGDLCIFSLNTVLTAEGNCFAFNSLNPSEIYTDE